MNHVTHQWFIEANFAFESFSNNLNLELWTKEKLKEAGM